MNKFRFDETKHEYWNGKIKLLSVNQIIDLAGWEYKFSNTQAMEKGKLAHKTIEMAVGGVLDRNALDPVLAVYLVAFERIKDELGFDIIATEQQLYSKRYPIAGTLDMVAMYNNKLTIIDLKTGQPNPKRERLQTAGYMSIYNGNKSPMDCVEQRMIIYLKTGTYVLFNNHVSDIETFKACIKIAFYKIS